MVEDWDHLIVLDGCRYDFFSEACWSHFEGDLERVISPGSNTVEWRDNSFSGRYEDVVYVSANPYINSRVAVKGFNSRDHFHDIVDVWDWGWDRELGTVHPETVNEAALESIEKYTGKRLIIHYLQPHCPYVGLQPEGTGYPPQEPAFRTVLDSTTENQGVPWIRRRLYDLVSAFSEKPVVRRLGFLGEDRLWRLRESFGLPPVSPMDAARRALGVDGLREAYRENLETVMRHASELLEALSGTVVVTSDHGERLGEDGRFSHGHGLSDQLLLEVPWLVVRR